MKTLLLEKGPVVRRRVLLVLVAGVPVLFLRTVNDPFNVPKLALLVAGVTLVAGLRAAEALQGAPSGGLKRLLFPAIVISVPLLVAWTASSYKGWSLLGLYGRFQGLVPYLVVIGLGVLIADAFEGGTRPVAWAFVVGGAVMGTYALIQWAGADPWEWTFGRTTTEKVALSTTGNSNFTGGYLGIVLPVAVGLVVLEGWKRWPAVSALALVVGGWYVADSQGGWAGGVAGTALTVGLLLAPRFSPARLLGWTAAALATVAAVGAVVLATVDPDNSYTSEQVTWRGWWWQAAINMAEDSPVWGEGPNTFAFRGPHFRVADEAAALNHSMADDPHSVFFSFLANAGILGALGFVLLLGWFVRTGVRAREPPVYTTLWIGAVAAYFVQSVASIDELSLRMGLWTGVGGLAASLAPAARSVGKARGSRRRRRPRSEPLSAWPAVVAMAIATVLAMWWAANLMVADGRVFRGAELFTQGRPEEAQREFERALDFRGEFRYRQTLGFRLGEVAVARAEEGRAYLADARRAFGYLDGFPDRIGLVTYARVLHAWAPFAPELDEDALDVYRRAMDIDPLNPMIKIEATDVLNALGRHADAVALLDTTVRTGESYSEFWGALALARVGLGDEEGARGAIDLALRMDPEDTRALQAQELIGDI